MIVLTADIHHMGLATRDQDVLPGSEWDAASRMATIAESFDIPLTWFVTGPACREDPDAAMGLARDFRGHEWGGHGWNCGQPRWLYNGIYRRLGRAHGPRNLQRRDIERTIEAVREVTGSAPRVWRNHAFRHDQNTRPLLAAAGIQAVSDRVTLGGGVTIDKHGLADVPVTLPPDHDHLVHGPFDAHAPPGRMGRQDRSLARRLPASAWSQYIKEAITKMPSRCHVILTHPACMQILDDFSTFKGLCTRISEQPTGTITDASTMRVEEI